MIAAIRSEQSVREAVLYVAFELSQRKWKLAMTSGFGVAPVVRTVDSGDWRAIERAVSDARARLQLPATTRVVSCYEAGREGFWLHRALVARQWDNRIVDSSSIETSRRGKRIKSDRIDALKLVAMLVRACLGELHVWKQVRVPSVTEEAARHRSRERTALVQERTALVNQMRGWLQTYGTGLPRLRRSEWWTQVTDWAGTPLPPEVQTRLARTEARVALVESQIAGLEREQAATVTAAGADSALARLVRLKGIATTGASTLLDEGLVWRQFRNRRELGGALGFAPAKYESGDSSRDQGITHAGNRRLQSVMVQLAWSWVRWQPDSALTQWFKARFGTGKRARKVGIVALARKLLIALWRWATQEVRPAGALLT
jgi:transposase